MPQHDVHLLAVELGDDGLDPRSSLTHRRALGIDALLPALNRNLRAAARLAGDAADHDRAVIDLRDLHLHQPSQEAAVRPAGHDHGSPRRAADLEHVRLEMLTDAVVLAGQLLADGENGLNALAHVENHGRLRRAMHDAGHDLALSAGVLLEHHVTLGLAKSLAIHLPGGLRRDAAQLRLRHVLGDPNLGAHAGGRIDLLGLGHQHLQLVVLDLLGCRDHLVLAIDADLAAVGVDLDHHVFRSVRIAPIGRFDCLLERLDQDLFGDALLCVQLKEGADEVSIHGAPRFRDEKTGRGMVNRPTSVLSSISIWSADLRPAKPAKVYQSAPTPANGGHGGAGPRGPVRRVRPIVSCRAAERCPGWRSG